MDRRHFIASTAAVAGATVFNNAMASGTKESPKSLSKTLSSSNQKKLIASTADCIETGRACLTHCANSLASGSTMMAECNVAVQNMLAACEAMNKIAHLNTLEQKAMKSFAASCQKVCEECYAQCKKHANHHAECKACMESCEDCIKVCKKIA